MKVSIRPVPSIAARVLSLLTLWLQLGLEAPTQAAEEPPGHLTQAATPTAVPAASTGGIEGHVLYSGKAPASPLFIRPMTFRGMRLAAGIPDESLLVAPKTNGIANVFIYLAKAPPGFTHVVPKGSQLILKKGGRFVPHSLFIQTGQKLEFQNRDPMNCTVHFFAERNATRPWSVPAAISTVPGFSTRLSLSEQAPFVVRDDETSWMKANILVLNHPFAAVTDSEGKFAISGLPAGTHEFRVWHEQGQMLDRKLSVTVTAGKVTSVSLAYPATSF